MPLRETQKGHLSASWEREFLLCWLVRVFSQYQRGESAIAGKSFLREGAMTPARAHWRLTAHPAHD
eukprot:12904082-Prorocentrum_lima.AAC.1